MKSKVKKREKREKKHFDEMATSYEDIYGYGDKFTKFKIKKKANDFISWVDSELGKGPLNILEIGCGTGAYTFEFASRPKTKILAIDISSKIIEVAKKKKRKKYNITFQVNSAYKTGLKKSSMDVICGFYVLHHLDFNAVKKEILRVLKPGGLLYLYEPNILNPAVLLIKSSKLLKKLRGDSLDEWAINPLTASSLWKGFEIVEVATSEFVWPLEFIPYNLKLFLDRTTSSFFSSIPGLNLIGGSVKICLKKI